ncbi:MAG: NADP-dependent phosphogluconate dehydrogenase [Candidatus Curtissbacteria bacterium]|nr:NADP-dependent phosphogluconate dehydrogenase [Candidatus Curtissbacteria bacterium]
MKLGFIGLGKMGNRMVIKLLGEGHEVVVWNRTKAKVDELKEEAASNWKLSDAESVADLVKKAGGDEPGPRIIWSMLPAGEATDEILEEVGKHVKEGDIVIDGGNSKFTDTDRRFGEFTSKGVEYLGIGVSGGIIAVEEGYPLMVGGSLTAYEYIEPILDSLAKPGGGHQYFGEGGAGHFVKMVHNAIEYGIMESIGEGFGLLAESPHNLDLLKVAQLYQKGTLVSGFMMARTIEVLQNDPELKTIKGIIGKASFETIWAVEEAKKRDLIFDIIERSLEIRNESEKDPKIQKSVAAKIVAGQRDAFGGHGVEKEEK